MLTITNNALTQLKALLAENNVSDGKLIRLVLTEDQVFDLVIDIPYEDDYVEQLNHEEVLVIQDGLYRALSNYVMDFNEQGELTINEV